MTRRKKKKQPKGILPKEIGYLLIFIAVVCLIYEPMRTGLYEKLEQTGYTQRDARQEETKSEAAPLHTDGKAKLEIPAPLKNVPELILQRKGYTVSYNRDLKIPNWVAWELTPEKLVERESRTNKFLPDPDLPEAEAVTTNDYKGAGMDRGHLCPAGDNRWHWKAMQESFYMTNICPQDHNLNRGDWKELEEACRRWAQKEGKIYIVCGPILYKQKHRTIGKQHKVTVPEAFFKVVLCADSRPPRAIGFIYKNTSGNRPLNSYVNSVDEVERITGIDFFPALPDKIEQKVEAEYDLKAWEN
ncbi:DNA/RNA non-specific endonuclease [Bacteroides sp.]|uniref:DNA/RNA non-specific endonuclease n=1 Tax=Bacteroides sp. TaxID=29523 RepID=UPI0023D6E7A0|nr:DNA/RNA non-specific endonuclease [Bacteroides sp.]MDE6216497.1 DNA/RNA non-specific endonuclease [Bacteroides sp.]